MKKKILLGLLVVLVLIQFIKIDKSTPVINPSEEFISLLKPSAEVASVLKTSCYDCHSYETQYPWYATIAPVSFYLSNHIKDGRRHLNFSTWGQYSEKKQNHKLEECIEMIEKDEMPMSSYTLIHKNATLTDVQKGQLVDWIKGVKGQLSQNIHE